MNKQRQHRPSISLYSGLRVDSVETLEEVLRLLDSLEDTKPRLLPGLTRLRVREVQTKAQEPKNGRRVIG